MGSATGRLAILKCKDCNPLFDLIEDVTLNFCIKECISKSKNTCFVVEASVEDNVKIYELLNNLEVGGNFLDCRFVDPEMVFLESKECIKELNQEETVDNTKSVDNVEINQEETVDNLEINQKESGDNTKSVDNTKLIDNRDNVDTPSFDLHDDRFMEMYINDDYIIDTSHDDYKKCSLLKYFIEAKRSYK